MTINKLTNYRRAWQLDYRLSIFTDERIPDDKIKKIMEIINDKK